MFLRSTTMDRLTLRVWDEPMNSVRDALLGITVVTTGLSAGLLAAFAYAVMPGLDRAGPVSAVPAMQRINVAILNPVFAVIFLGPLVFGALSIWAFWRSDLRWWIVAAVVLIVVGLLITAIVNVPANDRLAAAGDVSGGEVAAVWADFTTQWVRWNVIRAVATNAAFATLVAGLIAAR